jgi:hypothetical protein
MRFRTSEAGRVLKEVKSGQVKGIKHNRQNNKEFVILNRLHKFRV